LPSLVVEGAIAYAMARTVTICRRWRCSKPRLDPSSRSTRSSMAHQNRRPLLRASAAASSPPSARGRGRRLGGDGSVVIAAMSQCVDYVARSRARSLARGSPAVSTSAYQLSSLRASAFAGSAGEVLDGRRSRQEARPVQRALRPREGAGATATRSRRRLQTFGTRRCRSIPGVAAEIGFRLPLSRLAATTVHI